MITLLLATLSISSIAVIGAVLLGRIPSEKLENILHWLIALSAGTLLGGAFIHLLPEAIETQSSHAPVFLAVLAAYLLFFFIESILHWHHCHEEDCEQHTLGYMNLLGDGIHNFLDGLVLAAAFAVDINLGIVTAIAVALHEIPQEISDYGVLLYAGFNRKKALLLNALVALTTVLGGVVGWLIINQVDQLINILLPFAAGSFIYIATSDLVPQIKKQQRLGKAISSFLLVLLGIGLMFSLTLIE